MEKVSRLSRNYHRINNNVVGEIFIHGANDNIQNVMCHTIIESRLSSRCIVLAKRSFMQIALRDEMALPSEVRMK